MTYRTPLLALLTMVLTALALLPSGAEAYCRTSTCKECPRDPVTNCTIGGKPVSWPRTCVTFSMHDLASEYVDLETAGRLMEEAFAKWEAVRCPPDGKPPSIHVKRVDDVMCSENEYRSAQGNANIVMFRDDVWPYAGESNTLATTNVHFNDETGEIYDVDLEVNATKPLTFAEYTFPKAYVPGTNDLLSILTHEAGHFLGLDHSSDETAIMKVALDPGETHTTLSPDDEAAICAAYPPEREAEATCELPADQEFSVQCSLDPASGGACSVGGRIGADQHSVLAWLSGILTVLGYTARRRTRM